MHIEINNVEGKIIEPLTIDKLAAIQMECQFKVEGAEYKAYAYRNKKHGGFEYDGYKKLFNIQTRRFPVGLLRRVVNVASRFDTVDIVDKRVHLNDVYDYKFDKSYLRDYQHSAILTSVIHGNGIVKVATGGGKTVIAGYTIGILHKKSIFIVHTRDLLYQAIESFKRIFPGEKIGQIGDGWIDLQNITVATMQTLAILGGIKATKNKYDEDYDNQEEELSDGDINIHKKRFNEYVNSVQCVMMDEVQIVCSQTASAVRFMFKSADYAFGYSASPWRDDGSDLAIEAAFGERIVNVTASELIRRGYLVKPQIYIKYCGYEYNRFGLDNRNDYQYIYKKYIVENYSRNCKIVRDSVDQYNDGMNTLILVTQIIHGNTLAELIKSLYDIDVMFISGKSGMKKRKQAIEDMRNGKIQLMVASTIADVGLDIPRLDCIVEAGAGKSSVTALQRLGRIMRTFGDKDTCKFITYRDVAPFICNHVDKKIEIWKTEEEFVINEEEIL